jgi:hypothetical protein
MSSDIRAATPFATGAVTIESHATESASEMDAVTNESRDSP